MSKTIPGDSNGAAPEETPQSTDLKRRLSQDLPDAKRTKTDVQSPTEEVAVAPESGSEEKPANGVSSAAAEPEPAVSAPPTEVTETPAAVENAEPAAAAVEEVNPAPATEAPTTTVPEEQPAAETVEDTQTPVEEAKPEQVADKPEEDSTTEEAAKETKADDAVTEVDASAAAPELQESVIDLDTTIESVTENLPVEDNESTAAAAVTTIDDSTVDPVVSSSAVVVDETPSAMDVSEALEDVDKTLETPNVSICPPPSLLTNNRISELVLSNGSSTPNTSNPTTAEFQATPIKMSETEEEEEEEETTTEGFPSIASDDLKIKSLTSDGELLDVPSLPSLSNPPLLADQSDEGLKRLQETLKLVNGTTTPEVSSAAPSVIDDKSGVDYMSLDDVVANPEDLCFETAVNFHNGTLQSLLVQRLAKPVPLPAEVSSDAASEKSGSNGSTTSLGPFALPATLTHTASGLSVSSCSSTSGPRPFVLLGAQKSQVKGVSGLRTFLQDLLKKIPEEEKKKTGRTSKSRQSNSAAPTPKTPTEKRDSATPTKATEAAAPVAKKTVAFATSESLVGNFVMARWTDKKYYAGRVSAEKPGNKYLINFEDGANKTLTKDQIVFGNQTVVPLLNHECNVLVEPNVYETGLVVAVDPVACTYNVVTDSGTVTVPATDLYLDEDQAKSVQQANAVPDSSADTSLEAPSAGPSRRKRNSDVLQASPKAGPSNVAESVAAKKTKKR